jgi:hypothetical protein
MSFRDTLPNVGFWFTMNRFAPSALRLKANNRVPVQNRRHNASASHAKLRRVAVVVDRNRTDIARLLLDRGVPVDSVRFESVWY